MKVIVLYRAESDHARTVEEFLHEFQRRQPGSSIEKVDPDSREGIALANLYGIMMYPAILVLSNDGQLLNSWAGEQMPLMDELTVYSMTELPV